MFVYIRWNIWIDLNIFISRHACKYLWQAKNFGEVFDLQIMIFLTREYMESFTEIWICVENNILVNLNLFAYNFK